MLILLWSRNGTIFLFFQYNCLLTWSNRLFSLIFKFYRYSFMCLLLCSFSWGWALERPMKAWKKVFCCYYMYFVNVGISANIRFNKMISATTKMLWPTGNNIWEQNVLTTCIVLTINLIVQLLFQLCSSHVHANFSHPLKLSGGTPKLLWWWNQCILIYEVFIIY